MKDTAKISAAPSDDGSAPPAVAFNQFSSAAMALE